MIPKYTFLIPAYKAEYLYQALDSIQKQTYKNYQVIISDDYSPYNLKQIIKPFLNDPRFTYIRNNKNIGSYNLVKHWNLLLSRCKTEYFIMASDDDIYAPSFLEEIYDLQKNFPTINIYRSRVKRINENNDELMDDYTYPIFSNQHRFLYDMYTTRFIHCIGNYVFRTSSLLKIGGFVDFPLAWFSDDATIIALSESGVCNTKKSLFYFRTSGKNISSESSANKEFHKEKIKAAQQFYQWMKTFKTKKKEQTLTLLESEYFKRALFELKKQIIGHIYIHLKALSLMESIRLYMWLIKNNLFIEASDKFKYLYSCKIL